MITYSANLMRYIQTPKGYAASITNSTTAVTLATGATGVGSRLESLVASHAHTADIAIEVYLNDGTTDILIYKGTVTTAAKYLNILSAMFGADAVDKQFLILSPGHSLKVKTPTAVAAAVGFYSAGGDF